EHVVCIDKRSIVVSHTALATGSYRRHSLSCALGGSPDARVIDAKRQSVLDPTLILFRAGNGGDLRRDAGRRKCQLG
ncbi:MAG: hypothetical protein ACXVII_32770, partial [Solirubrobacteraceae bacterium]